MRDMIKDYVRGDLPSLSSLLAVVAAGERGGFTAAAQALGVTQSGGQPRDPPDRAAPRLRPVPPLAPRR